MNAALHAMIVALLVALTTSLAADPGREAPALVMMQTDSEADATRVRLLIENSGEHCTTLYIEPLIIAYQVPLKPNMLLSMELIDSKGKVIRMSPTVHGTFIGTKPQDVIRLGCGEIFGRRLDLESGLWFGELPPGTYRLRAKLTMRMRTFAKEQPSFVPGLARLSGKTEAEVWKYVKDLTLEAEEIEVTVH